MTKAWCNRQVFTTKREHDYMASELNIQTQIMKDARNQIENVFAMKMANHFLSGIPDLVIKAPGHEVLFVEVKKGIVTSKNEVKINTTPLQRQIIHAMRLAGLRTEVWTVVDDNGSIFMIRSEPSTTKVVCDDLSIFPRRIKGKGWPIEDFLNNPVRA